MLVTVVADEGDSDEGFVGERLELLGAQFRRFFRDDLREGTDLISRSDLLVLLGSDRSVHDSAERAVAAAERQLVRGAQSSGLPVLGICYGAQIVASTLGATVAPAPVAEIGWRRITSKAPELVSEGPWLEFHYDRFGPVPGVEMLAESPDAPQAFVHGRTLAVQFHPEVTAATFELWVTAGARRIRKLGVEVEELLAESVAIEPAARARCFELVDRFLADVASRRPCRRAEDQRA